MEHQFKAWAQSRSLLLNFFETYSLDQLNTIPEGFSNNLIWNIGNIIVAQQSLVYKSSGLPVSLREELIEMYKPGTKPTRDVSQAEVDELKDLLLSQIAQTKADFEKGIFTTYTERTTITGFHLASITDALEFNNYHEGIHLGYMMCIKRFV